MSFSRNIGDFALPINNYLRVFYPSMHNKNKNLFILFITVACVIGYFRCLNFTYCFVPASCLSLILKAQCCLCFLVYSMFPISIQLLKLYMAVVNIIHKKATRNYLFM